MKKNIFTLLIVITAFFNANAQLILDQPMTSGEFSDPQSITLKPGFSSGANFHAFIAGNCISLASSVSSNQNYIITYTARQPFRDASNMSLKTICDASQQIQYFDGLGRLIQTVQTKASPDAGKDLVQHVQYDQYGREAIKFLPYASTSNNGSFKTDALSSLISYYQSSPAGQYYNTGVPYAQTVFEQSPLNRIKEQGAPGAAWQPGGRTATSGRTIVTEYLNNTVSSGSYPVRSYSAVSGSAYTRSLQDNGWYTADKIYVTVTKDENWTSGRPHTTEEYKDKQGLVILKRNWLDATTSLSTYYVYDDFSNLCYVISPKAEGDNGNITTDKLNNLCFQYNYDGKNRLIKKKLPGKAWEYLVYNDLDQVILSQDGLQRQKNQWMFSKYDKSGRPVITGIYTRNIAPFDLQEEADAVEALWEQPLAGSATGYSNAAFPLQNIEYRSISFYDSYDNIPGKTASFNAITANSAVSSRGLLTGSRIYLANGTASYLTVNYYDDKGQATESVSENHIGGFDRVQNSYSFTGDLLNSTRDHTSSYDQVKATTAYAYDHMGRRKHIKENINNNSPVVLANFDYTETGQMLSHRMGNYTDYNNTIFSPQNFLQNISYLYNERGWLKRAQ